MISEAVAVWLQYRHPGCTPTLCVTWSQHLEQLGHVTVVGAGARPDLEMSAKAAQALAALGWTRTRNRRVVPYMVTATRLSQHQRLAAIARIEEALRQPSTDPAN